MVSIPHVPNPPQSQAFVARGRRGRPMLFQITDPLNRPLYPYMLALHVNPSSFEERMMTSKTVTATKGGYVEWIWPDELDAISANASTGAFIGPDTGLTAGSDGRISSSTSGGYVPTDGRRRTIAHERFTDLLELFHCNGMIYNGEGRPVIRGKVMCVYDRGIYIGHFTTFNVKETDEKAFSFELDWEFKAEAAVYIFPTSQREISAAEAPIANRSGLADLSDEERLQEEARAARVAALRARAAEGEPSAATPAQQEAAEQNTEEEVGVPSGVPISSVLSASPEAEPEPFEYDTFYVDDNEQRDVLDAYAQNLGYENYTEYVRAVGPENAGAAGLEAIAGYESQIAGTSIEEQALERAAREYGYESFEELRAAEGDGAAEAVRLNAIDDAYQDAQGRLPSATFTPETIAGLRAQGLSEPEIAALQAQQNQPDAPVGNLADPANLGVPAGQEATPDEVAEYQAHLRRNRGRRRTTEGEIEDYPGVVLTAEDRQRRLDDVAQDDGYDNWEALVAGEGEERAASIERFTVGDWTPPDPNREAPEPTTDPDILAHFGALSRQRR